MLKVFGTEARSGSLADPRGAAAAIDREKEQQHEQYCGTSRAFFARGDGRVRRFYYKVYVTIMFHFSKNSLVCAEDPNVMRSSG